MFVDLAETFGDAAAGHGRDAGACGRTTTWSSPDSTPTRACAGWGRTTTWCAPVSSTSPESRSSTAGTWCTGGRSATCWIGHRPRTRRPRAGGRRQLVGGAARHPAARLVPGVPRPRPRDLPGPGGVGGRLAADGAGTGATRGPGCLAPGRTAAGAGRLHGSRPRAALALPAQPAGRVLVADRTPRVADAHGHRRQPRPARAHLRRPPPAAPRLPCRRAARPGLGTCGSLGPYRRGAPLRPGGGRGSGERGRPDRAGAAADRRTRGAAGAVDPGDRDPYGLGSAAHRHRARGGRGARPVSAPQGPTP